MSASNASYVLGWEIAGLMDTKEHLKQHCTNIVTEASGKWGQIGLPAKFVQGMVYRSNIRRSTELTRLSRADLRVR